MDPEVIRRQDVANLVAGIILLASIAAFILGYWNDPGDPIALVLGASAMYLFGEDVYDMVTP